MKAATQCMLLRQGRFMHMCQCGFHAAAQPSMPLHKCSTDAQLWPEMLRCSERLQWVSTLIAWIANP